MDHQGSHDTIGETYGQLGRWLVHHALTVGGIVHEAYLVSPADTHDEGRWRTEIGWPVFRITT